MQETNTQLIDQNTLLKAQLAVNPSNVTNGPQIIESIKPLSSSIESSLLERVKTLEIERDEAKKEIERIRKDQDDLLELLTDQDLKLNTFKQRLRDLGETIDDDDSDNDNNSDGLENES